MSNNKAGRPYRKAAKKDVSQVLQLLDATQDTRNGIFIYPNVATNHINIKVVQAGSISIYTADGKLAKTLMLQKGINQLDISELSVGMYYGVMNAVPVKFIKK